LKGVDPIDDQHYLLAPFVNALEEATLALGKRPIGGGNEEDRVRARDELPGNGFMVLVGGFRSRGVYDLNLLEQFNRCSNDLGCLVLDAMMEALAVVYDLDARGRGYHTLRKKWLPQQ